MVHSFFAVTTTRTIFEVNDTKDKNGWPLLKQYNRPYEARLRHGTHVGIGADGLCLFRPDDLCGRDFERMPSNTRGGATSYIVGLFLGLGDANNCLRSGEHAKLSAHFIEETIATLGAIGADHPVFVIGKSLQTFPVAA